MLQMINATFQQKRSHAPYDLDVILYGPGNNGGFIKFRQNKDTAKIINLNTWVGNLRPNHPFLLQRAVNLITDTTQMLKHIMANTWVKD